MKMRSPRGLRVLRGLRGLFGLRVLRGNKSRQSCHSHLSMPGWYMYLSAGLKTRRYIAR